MAGVVVRADILEDKDGKSRGMGTVTFDMPIEAVQAVCILLTNVAWHIMYLCTCNVCLCRMLVGFNDNFLGFLNDFHSYVQWTVVVQQSHACQTGMLLTLIFVFCDLTTRALSKCVHIILFLRTRSPCLKILDRLSEVILFLVS